MKKCRLLVLIALALILVWGGVSCKQEPAFYTVKFEKNADKASGEMNPQLVKSNTETQLNQNLFTRQFYVFAGWSLTEDGKVEYKDKDKVKLSSDVTLYAQWVPDKMTIKFDADEEKAQGKMDDIVANAKSLVKLTKNAFTLEGYHFDSWYDEDLIEYNDEGEYEFIKDTTLYAWWEPNTYFVVFHSNYGEEDEEYSQFFTYDEEDELMPVEFRNPGYIFTGWNTKSDGSGTKYEDEEEVINLTAVNEGEFDLYAQWVADDFAGTEWRMPTGPSQYIQIVFGTGETAGKIKVWMSGDPEQIIFDGEYSVTADGNLVLSESKTEKDESIKVYAYLSIPENEGDKVFVYYSTNPAEKIADIEFERDFEDCFYYPEDNYMETETSPDGAFIQALGTKVDASYTRTIGKLFSAISSNGTFAYEDVETRIGKKRGEVKGEWTFGLTGTYDLEVSMNCPFKLNEAKTSVDIVLCIPDTVRYGEWTFTKVAPVPPTT